MSSYFAHPKTKAHVQSFFFGFLLQVLVTCLLGAFVTLKTCMSAFNFCECVSSHEHVCANDIKVENALQQPFSWREIKAFMEEFNHLSHMG
jgi:hypothetical protein